MLKVLHTGDWHIGSFPGPEVGGQNARFQDICRCLDFQEMYAEEHRPDLIVVSANCWRRKAHCRLPASQSATALLLHPRQRSTPSCMS